MKFDNKQLTSHFNGRAFLTFIDESAPEVFETLKTLVPKYREALGAFDIAEAMAICDGTVACKDKDGNRVLHVIDIGITHYYPNVPIPNVNLNSKNFLEFQQSFYEFIECYGLETEWLKRHIFTVLYYLLHSPQNCNKIALETTLAWTAYGGKSLLFKFNGWQIEKDSKDYEKAAIAAFRKHLRDYIEVRAKEAKEDGYKLMRRKREFDSVKWLVWWTVKRMGKEEIIKRIDEERSKRRRKETYTDISTLNKAFQKFKKFGLPVREE